MVTIKFEDAAPLVCRYTRSTSPSRRGEAPTDSSSPTDAMNAMDASRLCLRNDSTAALSETITLSRAAQRQAHGRHDLGQAHTQRITHRGGTGAADGRCRVTHGQHKRTRTH